MVATIAEAVELVRQVCLRSSMDHRFLDESSGDAGMLRQAIRNRDTPVLYD